MMMQMPASTSSANNLSSASPTSAIPRLVPPRAPPRPPPPSTRPSLPSRQVSEDTIEDAYVSFILYCNPAVPPDTDPTALKEAFRVPPKSEGKTFKTFALYVLIGKLMQKDEVKTWGDLALRLGVDPPNQEKNQSTQKIQQYAVRLKRWMKSMHIDAFFDYLYDNPHAYWTQIPPEATPILETARDGVAPEDDMALRALLPHIRPRRGRRTREDEEAIKSPSKLPRVESPMADEFVVTGRPESLDPWTAYPAGSAGANAPPGLITSSSNLPWAGDLSQAPCTPHPLSAVTPSTRSAFWADEPRSAITPGRGNRGHKRHGPKVVSSAWRSGQGSGGKTRGRPPMNRTSNDGPFSAYPGDGPPLSSFRQSAPEATVPAAPTTSWGGGGGANMAVADVLISPQTEAQPLPPYPTPPALPSLNAALSLHEQQPPSAQGERLSKPRGLSLQVPERVGSDVRLATPPPAVMVNGQAAPAVDGPGPPAPMAGAGPEASGRTQSGAAVYGGVVERPSSEPEMPSSGQKVFFRDPSDRTNIDALEGFFMHEIMTGNWVDSEGRPIARCGADEAHAIVSKVIESLQQEATTERGFLLNVSALAGGKLLMTTTSLKITVANVFADRTQYTCEWQLQLGDCKGMFKMEETVEHSKWRVPRPDKAHVDSYRDSGSATAAPDTAVSPAVGETSAGVAGNNSTDTISANGPTSFEADPSSSGSSGPHARQPPVTHGSGSGGPLEEEPVEYWKEKCRELTEKLQKQRSPEQLSADHWMEKYREILAMYKRKDREMARMQARIMDALRDQRLDRT